MLPIQKYIFAQYVKCAAKRDIPFCLTTDEFCKLIDCPCVYCGAKQTCKASRSQYAVSEYRYNGIDRVNSDLSYQIGNVVSCCKQCNAAKTDMALDVFLSSDWLKARKEVVNG